MRESAIPRLLKEMREEAGLSVRGLAREIGEEPSSYSYYESPTFKGAELPRPWRLKIARALETRGIRPERLALLGALPPNGAAGKVPLEGYVGAGQEVCPPDDLEEREGLELVERPPDEARRVVAVRVRGDSMLPTYKDGDTIYYADPDGQPGEALVGVECACRTADGRTFIKILRRGSRPGLWDLDSHNATTLHDQELCWASPILWLKKA